MSQQNPKRNSISSSNGNGSHHHCDHLAPLLITDVASYATDAIVNLGFDEYADDYAIFSESRDSISSLRSIPFDTIREDEECRDPRPSTNDKPSHTFLPVMTSRPTRQLSRSMNSNIGGIDDDENHNEWVFTNNPLQWFEKLVKTTQHAEALPIIAGKKKKTTTKKKLQDVKLPITIGNLKMGPDDEKCVAATDSVDADGIANANGNTPTGIPPPIPPRSSIAYASAATMTTNAEIATATTIAATTTTTAMMPTTNANTTAVMPHRESFSISAPFERLAVTARTDTMRSWNLSELYKFHTSSRTQVAFHPMLGQIHLLTNALEQGHNYDFITGAYQKLQQQFVDTSHWILDGNATMGSVRMIYHECIQKLRALTTAANNHQHCGDPVPTTSEVPDDRIPLRVDFQDYMRQWMVENWVNPYPDAATLHKMSTICHVDQASVSVWVVNSRNRKWRPSIAEAYSLNRPADMLLEDSIQIYLGEPLREIPNGNANDNNGTATEEYSIPASMSTKRARVM